MTRRVVVVAFQFPPYGGSSAVQRALSFVRYLPAAGWEPVVLTAEIRAYEDVAPEHLGGLPEGVHVERAFALDAKRHLSVRGRYPAFLAHPDRWRVWQWGARFAGMRLIRRFAPAAIWSTYPIVSAHDVALRLATRSRLPWIADFRDPMVEEDFPADSAIRADFARRELAYSRAAARFCVTTPGMRDWFVRRYPHLGAERVALIENGYDESAFASLPRAPAPLLPGSLTLLHSGELYPVIRDPANLFAAARRLLDRGLVAEGALRFRFRGAGDDSIVHRAAQRHGMAGSVETLPRVPYREALAEMMAAGGLVILQGADCNRQIPAKVYEYMRSGRPVLGITDPAGDTGRVLASGGYNCVAPLESVTAIESALARFVTPEGRAVTITREAVAACSREGRARALAGLLDAVTTEARS
jgi:glycosyltransferase involved in cell wall biosynthesis